MGGADKPRMRPLIGVTTSELRPSGAGTLRRQGEPAHPEMALGMTYLQAIERAGGMPVVLPPVIDDVERLLDRLDGAEANVALPLGGELGESPLLVEAVLDHLAGRRMVVFSRGGRDSFRIHRFSM